MAPIPKSKLAKRRGKISPNGGKPPTVRPSPTNPSSSSSLSSPSTSTATGKRRAENDTSKNKNEEPDTELVFEDPYGDDFEEEEIVQSNKKSEKTKFVRGAQPPKPVVYRPGKHKLEEGETLVCDESAYDVFYKCNVEWPALSFDYICTGSDGQFNNLNPSLLNAYPLSLSMVLGTQANTPSSNKLVFLRMSNLHRNPNRKKMDTLIKNKNQTKKEENSDSEDDSDEEEDDENDDDDDNSDDDENEDIDGKDPVSLSNIDMNGILQNNEIKMDSTINRIRVMPQLSNIIAYWTEKGRVNLIDANNNLNSLYLDKRNKNRMTLPNTPSPSSTKPFYSTRMHGIEGYALDWNRTTQGYLLSGACDGSIYLSKPASNQTASSWTTVVDKFRASSSSVEDIQWSPNEPNVFASCHSAPDSHINIWDIRQYRKPALNIPYAHSKNVDINVTSWNRLESHLLTSGGDNGVIKVWDLRTLSSSSGSSSKNSDNNCEAAAEFSLHRKAITSIQWHPTDASMLCASSEDGSVSIWDLAVERDAEEEIRDGIVVDGADEFPPQLLFIHMGQKNVKDAQWHPACPSLIVSTAEDGINIFQPGNIALPT